MYTNKIVKTLGSMVILLGSLLTFSACGEQEPAEDTAATTQADSGSIPVAAEFTGEINVVGSTTVQPLAELLAAGFESMNPDLAIMVQGGGSSVGVTSASDGTADIGMASREIKQTELDACPELRVHVIARDGIAIVTEPGMSVTDLSLEQVRGIFAGDIANWNEVGGPDQVITVVAREEGSGTRAAFEELIMGEEAIITDAAILQPSNGAVRTTVSVTPGAIAFISFGYLDETTVPIAIDGVLPTEANAASGAYKIVRPLNMLTLGEPEGAVAAWLEFIQSPDGQAIVAAEGYLPVN
jgi:phosphate transport system substrate-binding protein